MTSKELKEKYDKPIDRIRHMSNLQILARCLLFFFVLSALSAVVYVVMNGVPVFGLPSKSSIAQAEISAPRLTEKSVIVTDEEYIGYARNIVSYLGTDFGEYEGDPGEPYVYIKYTTQKGKVYEIAANETAVFYNGEVKPLKREGMFVVIAEGVFFPELTKYVITAQQ